MSNQADNIDERLDRLVAMTEANAIANATNTQDIANLRVSINELREGQALLTQFFVEQREASARLENSTNVAIERIDRILDYLTRRIDGSIN